MLVLLNSVIFFIIYLFLQVFLYRFLKININKFSTIIFIAIFSIFVAFYSYSIEIIMNLISINLMNICFYIMMFGVFNKGPSLIIVDLFS